MLELIKTPIQYLPYYSTDNKIWCKREDLQPYSFGGNKVRFANAYLKDMIKHNCNGMIIYGGYPSNMCRILAAACYSKGIPCSMVLNEDIKGQDEISFNGKLITSCDVKVYKCSRNNICKTVNIAIHEMQSRGYAPYYMYGMPDGSGNELITLQACADLALEISQQEREQNIHYSHIVLASGTSITQSGLICGESMVDNPSKIVGISVSRKQEQAFEVIQRNLAIWARINKNTSLKALNDSIFVEDSYLCGGYGFYSDNILKLCKEMYLKEGICMDTTYVGKAFWGMLQFLKKNNIHNQNILFIHTGGLPIFIESVDKILNVE